MIHAKDAPETLDIACRIVMEYWPNAAFQNPNSGRWYGGYRDIAFGKIDQIFIHKTQNDESVILYLILDKRGLTVAYSKPSKEVDDIVQSLTEALET